MLLLKTITVVPILSHAIIYSYFCFYGVECVRLVRRCQVAPMPTNQAAAASCCPDTTGGLICTWQAWPLLTYKIPTISYPIHDTSIFVDNTECGDFRLRLSALSPNLNSGWIYHSTASSYPLDANLAVWARDQI